jgi:hypothetical protein
MGSHGGGNSSQQIPSEAADLLEITPSQSVVTLQGYQTARNYIY